jgi:rare lipoprotein A
MRFSILASTFAVALFAGSTLSLAADDPPTGNSDLHRKTQRHAQPTGNGDRHRKTERLAQRQGKASVYDDSFQGKKTATGEPFSQEKMTAAAKDLPLGSHVTVTNKENGKSVDVKVNDRGPHVKGRVIDLSKKAATTIGITPKDGVAPVKVEARPSSQPTDELKEAVREKAAGRGGEQEAEGSAAPPR